ncbi:MAG: hypothetical protein KKB76_05405 [Candidatus Omnitrophica bacterium]|nr:hypothetical protein [Candidatus Omnitrophota bacterium]
MTTLKEAIEVIRSIEIEKSNLKTDIADELLGKYKGIIPKEKTSTEFIKELRGTLYGKTQ